MDKKMYFEPEMEVVELELQGMLAASPEGVNDDLEPVVDPTPGGQSDFPEE